MNYPFTITIDNYYGEMSFDERAAFDTWLKGMGIIPEITQTVTIRNSVLVEVKQFNIVEGKIIRDEGWPHQAKKETHLFRIEESPPLFLDRFKGQS